MQLVQSFMESGCKGWSIKTVYYSRTTSRTLYRPSAHHQEIYNCVDPLNVQDVGWVDPIPRLEGYTHTTCITRMMALATEFGDLFSRLPASHFSFLCFVSLHGQ